MQHGQTTENVKCELHQFERNRYFYGKLMTVRDFETEQRYSQGHRYLHNQSLHGWGVVCGLTVEPKGGPGNERKIVVHPGVALDCCGHEMVLARDQEVDLSNFQTTIGDVQATGKTIYLCIKYDECTREPVPALANVSTCEEVCDYNRIQEHVAFEVLTELPTPEASEACETWMNLTTVRSEIEGDEVVIGGFERITPRWVRPGDVFEVRRRITPFASGRTTQLADTLPTGFSLLDGALDMEVTNTIEGKVAHSTYLVKVDTAVALGTYQITGQVLQSPPTNLPPSGIEVIASTQELEQQIQEELFTQEFAECPRCAEDANSRCVVLASVALQQQDSSFVVRSIDDVTLDAARGIYRQLVYHTPLIVELLECLKNDPRLSDARIPLPHAETHQDGGTDEINVTNLSGVLAEAQRVAAQANDGPVFTRTRLNFIGPGVSASDDAGNNRINITVPGGAAARIFTGEVTVNITIGGRIPPVTVLVEELNDGEPFAVVLAPQLPANTSPLPDSLPLNRNLPGAHVIFGSIPDFTRAFVAFIPQPYNRTFEIHGRVGPELSPIEGPPFPLVVVCWVIAGAQEVAPRIL